VGCPRQSGKKEIRKKGANVAYGEPDRGMAWRARYKRPDGTYGSRSGFSSRTAAEEWGDEQEALIRRNIWIDPRDAETLFGLFVEEWLAAVSPRLEPNTTAKYRSVIDNHLLPQWQAWPMIGIFNCSLEIEKWVSELHEEYADSTVSTIFALFSTVTNAAVRARMIPASPCQGIRVTSGEFDVSRLVATPVQVLRTAMGLYEPVGLGGFVLCLMDAYTGARWSELNCSPSPRYRRAPVPVGPVVPRTRRGEPRHRREPGSWNYRRASRSSTRSCWTVIDTRL
jgi:hypothetical protein